MQSSSLRAVLALLGWSDPRTTSLIRKFNTSCRFTLTTTALIAALLMTGCSRGFLGRPAQAERTDSPQREFAARLTSAEEPETDVQADDPPRPAKPRAAPRVQQQPSSDDPLPVGPKVVAPPIPDDPGPPVQAPAVPSARQPPNAGVRQPRDNGAPQPLDNGNEPVLKLHNAEKPPARQVAPADPPRRLLVEDAGVRIDLHLDKSDVQKAFEILSRQANLNIMVSPGVSGQVTVDLRNVTVDEAMRALCSSCNLTMKNKAGILHVYAATDEQELPVRVYKLNYVTSTDLDKMVRPLLSPKGIMTATPTSEVGIAANSDKAGGNSLAGGESLVVQDYERNLQTVDRVIAQIDVKPVQVLIEAVIISVKLEKGKELGINFAVLDNAQNALVVAGNGAAINAASGFTPASLVTAGGKLASGSSQEEGGLKFGFVDKNVTGFIRALETCGETKILASPRLLVLNKQRAELQLGERLGYQTFSQSQVSTVQNVQFMNIGTQLRLRPFVSSDGMVRMEIHPERSSGKVVNNVPQTSTSEVTTNVMVPDGATIVIGGLMQDEKQVEMQGVLGLGGLPLIGPLFRDRRQVEKRDELVVILTPRIWNPAQPEALNGTAPARHEELRQELGVDRPKNCDKCRCATDVTDMLK